MGFDKITVTPSPVLMAKGPLGIIGKLYFQVSMLIYRLTFNKLIITPSCFFIAKKN